MDTSSKLQPPRGPATQAPAIEPDAGGVLRLAQLCFAQLDREQAYLETARDVLRQVYAAGVASKAQRLADLLEPQRAVALAAAEVRAERDRFRAEASAVLGLPLSDVTV